MIILAACSSATPEDVHSNTVNSISQDQDFDMRMSLNRPNISKCYRDGLKGKTVEGDKALVYVISTGNFGGVTEATLQSSELGIPEIEECIRKTFLGLKFPKETNSDLRYFLRTSKL